MNGITGMLTLAKQTINKDTKGVYNEHEQRLDVMHFMNMRQRIPVFLMLCFGITSLMMRQH